MALVVSVTPTASDTNCSTVPIAVAVAVGAALKKPLIPTETKCVASNPVAVETAQFRR